MSEIKSQQSQQARDFKDRFEFKLTMKNKEDGSENIICQRYFKINYYNPTSVMSYDIVDTISECARMIDEDLKSKTLTYLEIFASRYFDTVDEMNEYFKNPAHSRFKKQMHLGEGIVVRENPEHGYYWDGEKPVEMEFKFNDGELGGPLTSADFVEYKLAFYDYGQDFLKNNVPHELCSTVWTGVYPKYVRNSIDLSNKRGRVDVDDLSKLSFEQYLMYKLVEGRQDLVYQIIKNICQTCSQQDYELYEASDEYTNKKTGKKTEYNNTQTSFRGKSPQKKNKPDMTIGGR